MMFFQNIDNLFSSDIGSLENVALHRTFREVRKSGRLSQEVASSFVKKSDNLYSSCKEQAYPHINLASLHEQFRLYDVFSKHRQPLA
jgi:uncharacterized protein YktA (UPF0223 family)